MKRLYIVPAVLLVSASLGMAQVTGQAASGAPKPAPNAWMLVPTPVSASDNVPAALRQARDQEFDGILLLTEPLTPELAARIPTPHGAIITTAPEIPEITNRAILIGKFTSSRTVMSSSGRAIYTEMIFHVSDVFEDVAGHAAPGYDITIGVLGGTVRTKEGQVISLYTSPREYSLQPGHTYLLVLRYLPETDLYSGSGWDVSDGVVRANSRRDLYYERHGKSSLIGLTVDQLRAVLRQRFQTKR